MSGAHYAFAWAACIVSIGLPVGIFMAIKRQEDRERRRDDGSLDRVEIDGDIYLRRYRFLWGSMPAAVLLLALVAMPIVSCGSSGCGDSDVSLLLRLVSLILGLFAWALTTSLLYNRYFQSGATRPFRLASGAERLMLRTSQLLGGVALVLMVIGLTR